jgi:hypothetical protein
VLDLESAHRSTRREGKGIVGYLNRGAEAGATTKAEGVRYGNLFAAGVCGIVASFPPNLPVANGCAKLSRAHQLWISVLDFATQSLAFVGNPQFAIPLLVALL